MAEAPILARIEARAGRLTLNRPVALHALTTEMCALMTEALLGWRGDPAVEWVIIDHAPGTRGFCAGGDVRMLARSGQDDGAEAREFFRTEYRLNTLLKEYPKPVIALMDGVTMGGGVGISVHGPYRVATERTLFAMPESGIGLFPDVGGGWFLPRLEGELGPWLALTGARLKGLDVLAAGVATHMAAAEALPDLTEALEREGPAALASLQTEAAGSFAPHRAEMDRAFGEADLVGVLAALDAAGSDWAREQAQAMRAKSPLTMMIALRQLREGAAMDDFRDVMRMEYRIASRIVMTPNFHEGVRAVLIDKDNQPDWRPSMAEAREDMTDPFFAPLGEDELTFLD